MNTPVIGVKQLTKAFGQQTVLKQLDWQVPKGRVIGLLGRNGAGKSTLLECLLGLRPADSGSISLFGATPRPTAGRGARQHRLCAAAIGLV